MTMQTSYCVASPQLLIGGFAKLLCDISTVDYCWLFSGSDDGYPSFIWYGIYVTLCKSILYTHFVDASVPDYLASKVADSTKIDEHLYIWDEINTMCASARSKKVLFYFLK
jgi:hypothetical protein